MQSTKNKEIENQIENFLKEYFKKNTNIYRCLNNWEKIDIGYHRKHKNCFPNFDSNDCIDLSEYTEYNYIQKTLIYKSYDKRYILKIYMNEYFINKIVKNIMQKLDKDIKKESDKQNKFFYQSKNESLYKVPYIYTFSIYNNKTIGPISIILMDNASYITNSDNLVSLRHIENTKKNEINSKKLIEKIENDEKEIGEYHGDINTNGNILTDKYYPFQPDKTVLLDFGSQQNIFNKEIFLKELNKLSPIIEKKRFISIETIDSENSN